MKLHLRTLSVLPSFLAVVLAAAQTPPMRASKATAAAAGSSTFIENAGQWDSRAQFLSQANGLNLWVTSEGPVFEFRKFIPTGVTHHSTEGSEPTEEEAISKGVAGSSSLLRLPGSPNGARILSEGRSPGNGRPLNSESPEGAKLPSLPGQGYIKGHVVKMTFINANPSAITGQSVQKSKFNYFLGNDKTKWVSNARSYAQVTAERPYDGISIRYSIDQGTPRYDVIVKPGADPSQVGIKIEGADDARVLENGNLELKTSLGTVEERGLTAYQETPNGRTQVPCKMVMDGNTVHFDTGGYDPAKTLVIDPLVASTYLGGSGIQQANGLALDSANDIYVTGYTNSTDFPTTIGAYQDEITNSVFVSKLDPAETTLIYSSVFGGSKQSNAGFGIAVDAAGNAFVAGQTNSIDFPTTSGVFQPIALTGGGTTGFVTELNATGSSLVYSSFLGGSSEDRPYAIAVDAQDEAVVTGTTDSDNFPVTSGAFQTTNKANANSTFNAFVTEVNPTGTKLIYSTYLGGSGTNLGDGDSALAVAFDSSGNAVVGGFAFSGDFPVTAGAYQGVDGEATDEYGTGFVTKLNSSGTGLIFSTFLGGAGNPVSGQGDSVNALAIDSVGNIVVTGTTGATDFPVTTGAFLKTDPNAATPNVCGFVTSLNPTATQLNYSTYYGGADGAEFEPEAIALDEAGDAVIAGGTYSRKLITSTGYQSSCPGTGQDSCAFVAEIAEDGTAPLYGSYLGGTPDNLGLGDEAYAVKVNHAGNFVVAGFTTSTNFPVTGGALESSLAGGGESAFVTTLGNSIFSNFTIEPNPVVGGVTAGAILTLAEEPNSSIVFDVSSPSSLVTLPAKITLPAKTVTTSFDVVTAAVTTTTLVPVTITTNSVFESATCVLTLVPASLVGVQINPNSVTGGSNATGTVQLAIQPTESNLYVQLSSTSGAAVVPAQVTVPFGAMSASFPVATTGVNTATVATITATYGAQSVHSTLTVKPATVLNLGAAPASVVGATASTGTVNLNGPAGPSGAVVSLSSSTTEATVPATVKVAAGAASAQFTIDTIAVSSQTLVTLKATYNNSSLTTALILTPATISNLSVSDSLALGSTDATGTVQLGSAAGPAGDVIKLSSNSIRATVPATVKVLGGHTSATFPITTTVVSSDTVVTITATYGFSSKTTTLTVLPAPLSSLSASPSSITGGNNASITVALAGVAGPYGNVIKFAANSPALHLPPTETIPAGTSSHTFSVPTIAVSSTTVVKITDTFWVYSQTTTLTLTPAPILRLTFNPSPVVGGKTTTGTVLLSGVAGASGDVVKISSNSADATVPTTVTVPANNNTAQFTVHTVAVSAAKTVTITVTLGTSTVSQTLTISP